MTPIEINNNENNIEGNITQYHFDNTIKLLNTNIDKDSFDRQIFRNFPNLVIIKKYLIFDYNSEIENIKPILNELNILPKKILEKICKNKIRICISDKDITHRSTTSELRNQHPDGYHEGATFENCCGLYYKGIIYVGRHKRNDGTYNEYNYEYNSNKNNSDSVIYHELGHAFDKNDNEIKFSMTNKFKLFHRMFYNKLGNYFQQDGPGGKKGCNEFFAEAVAEFLKWGKIKFQNYYNKSFYDYIKNAIYS